MSETEFIKLLKFIFVCAVILVWIGGVVGVFLVVRPWYRRWCKRLGRHPTLDDVMHGDLFTAFKRKPTQEEAMNPPRNESMESAEYWQSLKIDPRRDAEQKLLEKMQDADPHVRARAKGVLAERYWLGICDGDPGPPLTPDEQRDLNWKMHCIERSRGLLYFVAGDGMEQLLTSRHKNEWEEGIEGMELVGAVKSAQACREVLAMFKQAMRPGRREDLGQEMVIEIRKKEGERYFDLERRIAGEGEGEMIEDYVIRNRELFLRNRGDKSWKELGLHLA